MSNHKFAQLAVALLVAHTCQIVHAGPPGVGGATEFTQIMNNSELLKIGADGAMTSINTTNQYLTQLQQYRNQLLNTVGMDPSLLNSRLNSLDQSYQQVTNYRNLLTRTQGSIGTQIDAWTTRYDAARLSNRTLQQQVEAEAMLRSQRNATAMAQAKRDEEILQQVNSDIADLREAEAGIPSSLGVNQSIQNTHRTLNKIAYQNATIIELLTRNNAYSRDAATDKIMDAEAMKRRASQVQSYNNDLRKRQADFVNSMAPQE